MLGVCCGVAAEFSLSLSLSLSLCIKNTVDKTKYGYIYVGDCGEVYICSLSYCVRPVSLSLSLSLSLYLYLYLSLSGYLPYIMSSISISVHMVRRSWRQTWAEREITTCTISE